MEIRNETGEDVEYVVVGDRELADWMVCYDGSSWNATLDNKPWALDRGWKYLQGGLSQDAAEVLALALTVDMTDPDFPADGEPAALLRLRKSVGAEGRPGSGRAATTPAAAFDRLAADLVRGFLVPACELFASPATEPHDWWKPVNRAAGAIAGWVSTFDPEVVDRLRLAQNLTNTCLRLLLSRGRKPWQPVRSIVDESKMEAMICGDNGLSKRVAECLLALGVER